MAVLIANEGDLDTLISEDEVVATVEAVLACEGVAREVEVSVSFVDRQTIHDLNAAWRGIDAPTDVLSFECDALDDDTIPAEETLELGDVILAPEVIAAQAPEFGMTPVEECRLMLTHGVLHLLGYDHMDDGDARDMEDRELAILRSLAESRGEDPGTVKIGPTTRHDCD